MNVATTPSPRSRRTAVLIALAVVATACGDGDAAPEDALPTLPVVEFESAPVRGERMFGNGIDDAPELPGEQADDDEAADAGESFDSTGDVGEIPPATPTPEEWRPFCHLLAQIEGADMPTDPAEELVVVRAWLKTLRAHAPDEIAPDVALVEQAVASVSAVSEFETFDDARLERLEQAGSRIDAAVDRSCA